MKAIAIVTAAFLSSACFAQYGDLFPDVPDNHWVYETLYKLHQANIIDSPLSLMFRGGRPPSRMDVANWAMHASSVMLSRLESAELERTKGDYGLRDARAQASAIGKLAKETDNLAKMAFLFEPELKRRHIDSMALRRDMLSFPKRIERLGLLMVQLPEKAMKIGETWEMPMICFAAMQGNPQEKRLTVQEACELLRTCPSYELLCLMTFDAETLKRDYLQDLGFLIPRPLNECSVETVVTTMRAINKLSTESLAQLFEIFQREYQVIEDGFDPTIARIFTKFELEQFNEISRKCYLLAKFCFNTPVSAPWVVDESARLTLKPTKRGYPLFNVRSFGPPRAIYAEYSSFPRR